MLRWVHFLPALAILLGLLWMHFQMARWLTASPSFRPFRIKRWTVWVVAGLLGGLLICGWTWRMPPVVRALLPEAWLPWVRAAALAWAFVSIGAFCAALVWRHLPKFDADRRRLLRATGGALLAAPVAATGFGVFVQRGALRVREIDIPFTGLPRDLDGLRLVQLSDIHLGPFLSEKELARAVDVANELRAHLGLVTGDLITSSGDPLDACLRQLARLRADAGILGCLGNHEGYADAEQYTTEQGARLGVNFLRGESRRLRFGRSFLNVAGVDYQSMSRPYLTNAASLVAPGAVNVLLSHNPDVFPVAVKQGYDLTVAGHTHGGQVNFEVLHKSLNIARFFTPYVHGLYRQGPSSIYVTRGIGTVGIPARIGSPPEVALIRLCAT